MKQIYFVRHSIRDITNKNDQDAPLTSLGKRKAHQLIDFFQDKAIERIFASPYVRTLQTVQPLADFFDLEIVTDSNLRERKVGTWVSDFPTFARKQWQDFDYRLPKGESLNQVKQRILPSYQHILNHSAKTIIICGHGTAFSVLFHHLTQGNFTYQDFEQMQMPDIFLAEYQLNSLEAFIKLT